MGIHLDFPATPVSGDKYPTTPVAGQPQYTWDGEKWTTVGAQISTAPPATALPLMDQTTALVGTAAKWAREDHVHPKIYAAPMDAMAYSGMQINGSMEVSQENAHGTTVSAEAKYICDGWFLTKVGTMVPSVTSGAGGVSGFTYSLQLFIGTAQASLGDGDWTAVVHPIEGTRISRLAWGTGAAQPLTIGFWAQHHRTGTYTGVVRNGASNRTYAFSYTMNVADTPEYKTVTIPGDTGGTWSNDNTVGMYVIFAVACGTTATAPSLNAWLSGNYIAGPGQVNSVAATSDAFRITGLIVLPGIEAPSAARSPLIMRPFDQELLTCQRYYEKGKQPHLYTQPAPAGITAAYGSLPFKVTKRSAATIIGGTGWQYFNTSGINQPCTPVFSADDVNFWFAVSGMTNWAGWYNSTGVWIADARL